MTRYAYDCTGGNAQWVKDNLPLPEVMFWYGTGSSSVQWNDAEKALFPASILVEIDQGGAGTPVLTAQVRDVENGAWGPGQAVNRNGWDVKRPTLYGSRSTLGQVAADGWRGDYWLAWPGWNGEPLPAYPGIVIVAVQNDWQASYDKSVILDATWPATTVPVTPAGSLSVTVISREAHLYCVPESSGDHAVVQYYTSGELAGVKLQEVAPVKAGEGFHLSPLTIPGASGGELKVWVISNGEATLAGSRTLP